MRARLCAIAHTEKITMAFFISKMNSILKTTIPFSVATRTIITLNLAVIAFHMLVLMQVIPYNVVWAGNLKTENEMYAFETLSVIINLILIVAVLTKTKAIKTNSSQTIVNVALWLFVIVFALNTLGNLTAKASIETYVATPLTFILALLCWRVAIANHSTKKAQHRLANISSDE